MPTAFLPTPDLPASELFEPANHGAAMAVLARLVEKRTPALSRGNPEVLARETKMTRGELEGITRRAKMLGFSNRGSTGTAATWERA